MSLLQRTRGLWERLVMLIRAHSISLPAVLLVAALLPKDTVAQGGHPVAPPVAPPPCSADLRGVILPDLNDSASLTPFAWRLFSRLTHAGANSLPMWEPWSTKEEVGLEPANARTPQLHARSHVVAPTMADRISRRFLRSLRVPTQTASAASRSPGLAPGAKGSQLSSVHYNVTAAGYIKGPGLAAFRSGSAALNLGCGSIIAKTIWEPFDLTSPLVTVSLLNAATERTWSQRTHQTNLSRPGIPQVLPDQGWSMIKFSDPASTVRPGKSTCLPGDKHTVPYGCIYTYPLGTGDILGQLQNQFPAGNCFDQCRLALVGLQLMVRTQPSANWVWISFWWTGHDHTSQLPPNVKLSPPWNYYEMAVTNNDRDTLTSSGDWNILFNPYLEGITTNGAVSNCATCHRNASMDKPRAQSMFPCVVGQPLGSPSLPLSKVQPAAARQASINAQYLRTVSSTDSLWSVAGTPPANLTPAAANALCQPVPQ